MRVAIVFSLCMLALLSVVVAGAQLRGGSPYMQQQQAAMQMQQAAQAQAQQSGELVSFLQQHQRAFAAQSAGEQPMQQQQSPSLAAQSAGAAAAPSGAGDASSGDVLAALEHAPSSLVQTESAVSDGAAVAAPGAEGSGQPFGACKTCVFVLERIKKGSNMLLPAICSELYHKYPDAYALCHQVLNALSVNGNNVRYWLFEGCFKYEVYMAKEWIKPCPSHVMCSVLKDLSAAPFCPALPMENPFTDA